MGPFVSSITTFPSAEEYQVCHLKFGLLSHFDIQLTSLTVVPPHPSESPLEVKVEAKFARLVLGENYTITCQTNSSARIGWTFNGGMLPTNVVQAGHQRVSSSLSILSASEKNSGQFACLATSPSGAYRGIDVIHVEVYGLYIMVISLEH